VEASSSSKHFFFEEKKLQKFAKAHQLILRSRPGPAHHNSALF